MTGPAVRGDELLVVQDLRVAFPGTQPDKAAVNGVSFAVRSGQTLARVGESGSGTSTGEVVEAADQATLYAKPVHEYPKELLAASPTTRVALSRGVARGRSMFPAEESR